MQTYDANNPDHNLLSGGMGGQDPHTNPLLLVHRLLRGRYLWAAGLGVLLAVPLAYFGYRSRTPMFTSQGVVAIAPTQRQILFQTEVSEAIPFFDQYVERQASLLNSQRVFNVALEDPRLSQAGWPTGSSGLGALDAAVNVDIPRRSGMIVLSVSHASAPAARGACDAILTAYERLHKDAATAEFVATETVLNDRERLMAGEVQRARELIRNKAEQHGTEDLQPIIDGLNREVLSLDVLIAQIESELASRGEAEVRDTATPTPGQAVDPSTLTPGMLAARDEQLADLITRRDQLVAEIEAYSSQYSPRHREVTQRQGLLATTERLIQSRAETVRQNWSTLGSTELASADELRLRLAQCRAQRGRLFERMSRLATDMTAILAWQAQAARAESDRQEATQRLTELRTEQANSRIGRAEIQQAATLPTSPSSDKRMMFAALGGGAGLGAGFGILAALGLLRGGFRYIDEFDGDKGSILLGVVPDLGGRQEPTAEAALCIHHARALLDRRVSTPKGRGRVIAVTSPTAGDGKTTVCCSLATSFAMAGFKTVIVDADFIGRGMTSRLGMDTHVGLGDILAGGSMPDAMSPGGTELLTIIPAGREESMPADRMAGSALGPVLDRLAKDHDIVLVDSGPVLGSIEATVVVGLADAVLAVVSRGQSVKMFTAMRRKLRSLGADLSGVIFNRAYPKDFAHSTHTSVVSAQSQRSRTVQVPDFVTMGKRGMANRLVGDAAATEAQAKSA